MSIRNVFEQDYFYSDKKFDETTIYVVKRTEKTIVVNITKHHFDTNYDEIICYQKRLKCGRIKYKSTESFYYKGIWYNADELESFY